MFSERARYNIREKFIPRTKLNRTEVAKQIEEQGFVTLPKDARVDVHILTDEKFIRRRVTLEEDHEAHMVIYGMFEPDSKPLRRVRDEVEENEPFMDRLFRNVLPDAPEAERIQIPPHEMEHVIHAATAGIAKHLLEKDADLDFLIKEPKAAEGIDALTIHKVTIFTRMSGKYPPQTS